MKCLNTPVCWRVEGSLEIVFKSKKRWVVGNGAVLQTLSLYRAGQLRVIVALGGFGKDKEKHVIVDAWHVSKIIYGGDQIVWTSDVD